MYTQEITVQNEVGLHARPATYFIQKANEFKSGIWVEKEERRVNAKSLLGVLSLGIVKGTNIALIADGSDEKEAVDALVSLIQNNFGEYRPNMKQRRCLLSASTGVVLLLSSRRASASTPDSVSFRRFFPCSSMVRSLHKRTPPAWPEASFSCVPLPPMGPPGQQPQPQPLLFWVLPQPQPLPPQNRHRMMMAMMIHQQQPPKQEF